MQICHCLYLKYLLYGWMSRRRGQRSQGPERPFHKNQEVGERWSGGGGGASSMIDRSSNRCLTGAEPTWRPVYQPCTAQPVCVHKGHKTNLSIQMKSTNTHSARVNRSGCYHCCEFPSLFVFLHYLISLLLAGAVRLVTGRYFTKIKAF